jgi:hypothetical protein
MNRIIRSNLSGLIISCVWVVSPEAFAAADSAAVNGAAASESRFILSLRIDRRTLISYVFCATLTSPVTSKIESVRENNMNSATQEATVKLLLSNSLVKVNRTDPVFPVYGSKGAHLRGIESFIYVGRWLSVNGESSMLQDSF